jgi:hypothetical protein
VKDKTWTESRVWTPVDIDADETTPLFNVAAGEAVIAAYYLVLTAAAASTAMTVGLGDGDGTTSYIAAFDPETATSAAGAGAYLAASGGKLYAADDTIDVIYAQTTEGAVAPKVRFTIVKRQVFP